MASRSASGRVVVLGAGSIGSYVGGSLLAAGVDVCLIGRPAMRQRLERHGLTLTDLHGQRLQLTGAQVPFAENPQPLAHASLILLCVKSRDTAGAAGTIARHARPGTPVVSLQNGIGNVDLLRQQLPGWPVLAAMVPFNVVQLADGRVHRGTEGELMIESSHWLAPWHAPFARAGLPLRERHDMAAVAWGKLLLNLNNPVNALSSLPLKTQLSQRGYRVVLAALIAEALSLMAAAGIVPAAVGRVPPRWMPGLLRLPDALFARLARSMLNIDAQARSSMWEDLQAGRPTEIDFLNGAVLELARSLGRDAPLNRRICALIHQAEGRPAPAMGGTDLMTALRRDP